MQHQTFHAHHAAAGAARQAGRSGVTRRPRGAAQFEAANATGDDVFEREADLAETLGAAVATLMLSLAEAAPGFAADQLVRFSVPAGSHPHDVAPAPNGMIWYTAQTSGKLGVPSDSP